MVSGRPPRFHSILPVEFHKDGSFIISVSSPSFVNFNKGKLAIKSTSSSSGCLDVAIFGAVFTFDSISGRLVIHQSYDNNSQPTLFEGTLFIPHNAEVKHLIIDAGWLNLEIDQNVRLNVHGCANLKTVSGNIQAHCIASRFAVSSVSGAIQINSAPTDHFVHSTKLSTVSGNIYADMVLDHNITIKSVSGCVTGRLRCPETFKKYDASITTETTSGETNMKIFDSGPDMHLAAQGDILYDHDVGSTTAPSAVETGLVTGFLRADHQSTSGNIVLEYPGALAGSVSIQTTSGMQVVNEKRRSGGLSEWRIGTGVGNSTIEVQSTSGEVHFLTRRNDLMCLKLERNMGFQFNGDVFGGVHGSTNGSTGLNMPENFTIISSTGNVMYSSGNNVNSTNIWGGTWDNGGTVWRDNATFLNRNHGRQATSSTDDFEEPPPHYDEPPPPYTG